jgi:hypothetical protein
MTGPDAARSMRRLDEEVLGRVDLSREDGRTGGPREPRPQVTLPMNCQEEA